MATMVKADVGEQTNDVIEQVQDKFGVNKTEATGMVLSMGAWAYETKDIREIPTNES